MAAGSVLAGFGFEYTQAVLVIGAVIFFSNVMSGMWGVVAVDFVQVAIILVGIPLVAVAAVTHAEPGDPGPRARHALRSHRHGHPGRLPDHAVPVLDLGVLRRLHALPVGPERPASRSGAASSRERSWSRSASARPSWAPRASARFPAVADGAVLTHVITTTLPPVLAGVVVSALLAAAMSTANALLISLAGCFSRDFYNKVLHPKAELDDLPRAVLYARLSVAVSLVVGVAVALRARGILDTIIIFNYPYMASLLVPLLGGLLWPRRHHPGRLCRDGGGRRHRPRRVRGRRAGTVPRPLQHRPGAARGLCGSAVVLVAVSLVDRSGLDRPSLAGPPATPSGWHSRRGFQFTRVAGGRLSTIAPGSGHTSTQLPSNQHSPG